MKISREEVEHVAHLARLHLSENELQKMTEQLDTILSYVQKLEELNTENLPPTTHAFSVSNAFRQDEVQASLSQQEALACSPQHTEEFFQVPRVI
jgi:aspartyl-tRNA(Asn)/glutamyl-tRNA(Gln) amidotransferase subunit C